MLKIRIQGTKYRVYYEDDVKGINKSYECEAVYVLGEEMHAEFQEVSYVIKGGRRDTDYRSRRDSKRDYKKLKK